MKQAAANKLFLQQEKIIGFIGSHQQGKGFMSLLIFFARECDNHQLISIAFSLEHEKNYEISSSKFADDL